MLKIILQLIALIILAISVVLIYNAREIATEHFNKNEKYSAIKTLKLVGLIVGIIGILILYMTIR